VSAGNRVLSNGPDRQGYMAAREAIYKNSPYMDMHQRAKMRDPESMYHNWKAENDTVF
jgi:hypothetical protein